MNNQVVIKADYFPSIPREDLNQIVKEEISLNDVAEIGSSFGLLAGAFIQAAAKVSNAEGLYRCVFPEGVSGTLAHFNATPNANLGTIMDNGKIVGQARWYPVEEMSSFLTIDPLTIAVAIALINVSHKLSTIQDTQEEIIRFLQNDKESELEGAVNSLSDIMNNYRFNSDNMVWKGSQLTVITDIRAKAEHNIIFYRKQIAEHMGKQKGFHSNQKADKLKEGLEKNLRYYQLGVYLYAYSSFMESILADNYKSDFLNHITEKINEYSLQYHNDYSQCYEVLNRYLEKSIQKKLVSGLGVASFVMGKAVEKMPVISKGPVDEALIAAGLKLDDYSEKHSEATLSDFEKNSDSGIQLFLDNLRILNSIANEPVEVLFDREKIYLVG